MSRFYKDAFDHHVRGYTLELILQPVFYWVCHLAGDDGWAYPEPGQLARLCDCSDEHIENASRELQARALVEYTPKGALTGTPVYRILLEPDRPVETTQRIVIDININVNGGAA